MKERKVILKAGSTEVFTISAESQQLAWNPPTLTTWEIKEETLSAVSGPAT
jgi:hypothetical protein